MQKEIFSFSRSMVFQCLLMFVGICLGLWVNGYFLVLVAGVTLFTAIFTGFNNVYYQLFFCLPFTMIYKLSPTSTSLFAYVMLAVGVILLFKLRNFGTAQFLLIMMFAIYVFLGMGSNVTTVIKMIIALILFYVFVKKIKAEDFKNQIMSFTLGMVGSSCIGLLKGSWYRLDMYYSDIDFISVDGANLIRFSGLYPDPNYFSVSVIVAITLCLLLLYNRDGNRMVLAISIMSLIVFGFMSYSKMFMLSILIVAVGFAFRVIEPAKRRAASMTFVAITVYIVWLWMSERNYMSIMVDRFLGGDISTGRFDIWANYMNYIWSSPKTFLFGDGLGASYRTVGGPHNTYIESIYFIGVIGSVLFALVLLTIFKSRRLIGKRTLFNYLLPIVFLLMILTLGCLTVNDLMFYCMLIWASLNYDTKLKESYSRT